MPLSINSELKASCRRIAYLSKIYSGEYLAMDLVEAQTFT